MRHCGSAPSSSVLTRPGERRDRKKGKTTDYATSQYIGNLHGFANGVVSVNAYGVLDLDTVTLPLAFRLYKPQRRLKPGDV